MNIVDRDIEKAEESADYTSFQYRQRNQDEQGASQASSSSIAGEDSREVLTASNTRASQHPDYLQRLATHKSQHLGTVGSSTCCKSQNSELPFGGGKPYPPKLPGREQYVVEFDGKDDPLHGMNWSTRKK
jgi:MFS transporter, DHA1 family, multidrug resistance protein